MINSIRYKKSLAAKILKCFIVSAKYGINNRKNTGDRGNTNYNSPQGHIFLNISEFHHIIIIPKNASSKIKK